MMIAVTVLMMLCQLATVPTPTQVALPDGPVNCVLTGNRTRQCLALPYAQPPLEELRWSPPQPPKPWTVVRDATRQMDACYQRGRGVSEDCLYLNVFAPRMLPPASSPGRVANSDMCCLASALSNFHSNRTYLCTTAVVSARVLLREACFYQTGVAGLN